MLYRILTVGDARYATRLVGYMEALGVEDLVDKLIDYKKARFSEAVFVKEVRTLDDKTSEDLFTTTIHMNSVLGLKLRKAGLLK